MRWMGDLAQAVESSYVSISFCRDRDRGLELGLSLRRDRLEQRPSKESFSLPETVTPQESHPADEEQVRS